jgi:hypothetical protein
LDKNSFYDWESKGILRRFSQTDMVESLIFEDTSLDDYGFIFYPNQCADGSISCQIHIATHGCNQGVTTKGQSDLSENFIRSFTYN